MHQVRLQHQDAPSHCRRGVFFFGTHRFLWDRAYSSELAETSAKAHHRQMDSPLQPFTNVRKAQRVVRSRLAGFTMMELLIAAVVVLLVTTLLLSLLTLHVIRHQVDSAAASVAGLQAQMIAFHEQTTEWPSSRTQLGLDADPTTSRSSYVQSVDLAGPQLDIVFGRRAHPQLAGMRLRLAAPVGPGGSGHWRCITLPQPSLVTPSLAFSPTNLPTRYYPEACREQLHQTDTGA